MILLPPNHIESFFSFHIHSYHQTSLGKGHKSNNQEVDPIEMSSLVGPMNNLDHTPFRSLRPRNPISSSGPRVSSPKSQRPVVCSVAPNLPVRPPSSSDNDSIRKNHWDMDYEGMWLCWEVVTALFYLLVISFEIHLPDNPPCWV